MGPRLFTLIALLCVLKFASACGSATFDGGSSGRPSADVYHGQDLDSLNWFWQCDSSPTEPPVGQNSNLVISGDGEHKFKSTSFSQTPLTFSGKVCPPVTYPRDIVFVIDVSGSMGGNGGNDPKTNNSCGRLRAVESIINEITNRGSAAQFAIVTFSSGVTARSSAMFSERASLFADITRGGPLANTLCAASGNTSYGAGLGAAEAILQGSRPGAIKEVYFVSDGEPTDSGGPAIAQRMKAPGVLVEGKSIPVTIATVMLGNADDTKLKPIASSESLHVGAVQAGDLATVLSQLAANDIIDGTMRYRPIGTDAWEEISLKDQLRDYVFSVPSLKLDISTAPNGLEVVFEYEDQHKNIYSKQGKILWLDAATKTN